MIRVLDPIKYWGLFFWTVTYGILKEVSVLSLFSDPTTLSGKVKSIFTGTILTFGAFLAFLTVVIKYFESRLCI